METSYPGSGLDMNHYDAIFRGPCAVTSRIHVGEQPDGWHKREDVSRLHRSAQTSGLTPGVGYTYCVRAAPERPTLEIATVRRSSVAIGSSPK